MYFLVASISDVSDCNQFLQERLCSCACSNTRAITHWDFQHTGESITQHAENSCKLPM